MSNNYTGYTYDKSYFKRAGSSNRKKGSYRIISSNNKSSIYGFNRNFNSYYTPLYARVRAVDKQGGGLFWMLIAGVIGLIVSAIVL